MQPPPQNSLHIPKSRRIPLRIVALATAATVVFGCWFSSANLYNASAFGLTALGVDAVICSALYLRFGRVPPRGPDGSFNEGVDTGPEWFLGTISMVVFYIAFNLFIYGGFLAVLVSSIAATINRFAQRATLVFAAICCALLAGGIFVGSAAALDRSKYPAIQGPPVRPYYLVFGGLLASSALAYVLISRSSSGSGGSTGDVS